MKELLKDYYYWFVIYRKRVLFTFLLLGIPLLLLYSYISDLYYSSLATTSATNVEEKLNKCNRYVYTLLEDNSILSTRIDRIKQFEQEVCERRIEEVLNKDLHE